MAAPSLNCTVPVAEAGVTVALKVTDCPSVDGFCDEVTAAVVGSCEILCDSAGEVLGASFVSPMYAAVIVCVPTANEETDKDAFPPAIGAVPSAVVPSANCTVPVAVIGVTVAVKGTACPIVAGFSAEVTCTLDATWLTACVRTADVLAALVASPL